MKMMMSCVEHDVKLKVSVEDDAVMALIKLMMSWSVT